MLEVAREVAVAFENTGREVPSLRVTDTVENLADMAAFLEAEHGARRAAIEAAGKAGAKDRELREMAQDLHEQPYRVLAELLRALLKEAATGRDGTNSIYLDRHRFDPRTGEHHVRIVVCGLRRLRIPAHAEVLILDGTADERLYREVFGDELEVLECKVERQAFVIQASDTTNCNSTLLTSRGDDEARAKIARIVRSIERLMGQAPLVGAQKKVREALEQDGALVGVPMLHFAAERGVNDFEDRKAVVVAGREQMPLVALEDQARAFKRSSAEAFVSLVGPDGKGEWRRGVRHQRMADGSRVPVEVDAHPDPITQALLEMRREGGVGQIADRCRPVYQPRLMALLSDLPVDVTVNRRLPQDEIDRVLEIAAEAKEELEAEGWFGLLLPAAKRGEERERNEARVAHVTELLHRLSASGLITSVTAVSPIEPLLAKTLQLTSFRVLVGDEKGGPTVEVVLLSRLPVAEAVRLARVEHPTLRLAPSSGTVVGDCFDRYGVVPGWSDLAAMMPEEVPDEAATEAVRKDPKEQEELERLKAQSWSVPYSVAGRRGPKPTALCDLTRVLDLAGLLKAFLGAEVTIDKPATLRATRARVTQVIHYSRVPGDPPGPVTEHLPPEQQYDIDLPVEGLRISPEALAAYFAWKGAQAGSACAA